MFGNSFGQNTTNQAQGFGQSNTNTGGTGFSFGGTQNTQTGGMFGGLSGNKPAGTGMFGANTGTGTGTGNGFSFGQQNNTNQGGGFNFGFNSGTTNTQTGGMFGTTPTTGGGMFGGATTGSGGMFGGTTGGFSFSTPNQTPTSGFGATATSSGGTGGMFGMFGTQPTQGTAFGANQPTSAFGVNQTAPMAGATSQNPNAQNLLNGLLGMMNSEAMQKLLNEGNTPFDELLRSCQNKETTTDNDSSFSRYDESEELLSRSRREAGIYASTSFPAFNRLPEVPIMTPSSN